MNSLSWMLYLADVAGSVSFLGASVAFGAAFGGITSQIIVSISTDLDNAYKADRKPAMASGWAAAKKFYVTALITAALVTPIPSKDTMYAIAASEMGESVLKSKTGGKAIQALNAWLDRQITPEKAEK